MWMCVLSLFAVPGGNAVAQQDGAAKNETTQVKPTQDVPAQDVPTQEKGIRTLHVYANLIQIPVLVLGHDRKPIAPPVVSNRFKVSIDSGPPYRVTHVRLEGDDPISLSILLDMNGPEDELMKKMDAAIAGLAPLSLRPRDHVSIYALDCGLERSLDDVPADHARLQAGVDAILQAWTNRKREKRREDCKDARHLWDALGVVARGLSSVPGRRVILAVTNGEDRGSKYKWTDVKTLAQSNGEAIFGLAYQPYLAGFYPGQYYEGAFNAVCELSGGMVMTANSDDLPDKLTQLTKMVRGRYIVEFSRPYNSTSGNHSLVVTIEKSDAFIRPAGISVPIADPAVLADPTTVPSDPSLTPEQGKRRPNGTR